LYICNIAKTNFEETQRHKIYINSVVTDLFIQQQLFRFIP